MFARIAFTLMLAVAGAAFPVAGAVGAGPSAVSELVIRSADGRAHAFKVEVMDDPAGRALGLMHRPSLAPDAGMLFDYGQEQAVSMWMKNTLIPLDMLFIAADGRVVHIAERTVPHSLVSIGTAQPVLGVLEINGGTVAHLGLKAGDRVEHPVFRRR